MVEAHYQLCLRRCNEKQGTELGPCKNNCFQKIQVPYKILAHQAVDAEEVLYKKCLASKFPNVTNEDYTKCTNNIYAQRVEMLMSHFANSSEKIFETIH